MCGRRGRSWYSRGPSGISGTNEVTTLHLGYLDQGQVLPGVSEDGFLQDWVSRWQQDTQLGLGAGCRGGSGEQPAEVGAESPLEHRGPVLVLHDLVSEGVVDSTVGSTVDLTVELMVVCNG